MGKEEMPVVPGPEEWDPNTEQKLIDKLYDRDMDFESDERSLELSRALGFPSVEAAKIYKKMASPFYNIENKEFSKDPVSFVLPWYRDEAGWDELPEEEKLKRTREFIEEMRAKADEILRAYE
ncbi:MAG: hypothetical protein A3F94_02270 [Candidatus Spechtbacteria bacterium RIFCSPLOWO2_12_FULL_38_22]|uniref:Uncharacterized protein n=1 Tax=Candidatus Spechtbacteria bacterium RIFCSPLOWO2_12_FULL_38_22 TaxID=1802165 RepID=A0A1G2HG75_9BACT|nr:MAG: hypothetical protein A2728_00020 [Candidatus Spechtbacteria bacterium RIFCSPHIGHO2_01_FULL_38_11]OGZ59538.1 MAG: hypothetical protein A3E58_02510 [Candidatus Spechtbacteria bacterium RIFCSPHIGHO2_12_FULL_38_30]OGZ60635.1 MAG: hypothetical protein A3A00_01970 [Candidatus Spechtbacteria bacterium RIFCSPLOWO2_01_FULL_38_20]OGZ61369.1 MAG: hypothetical protein A3F94_02270 [Candidatus Spechtbacteria bacterium RIFCSPLOWO2_12_FULL_38_22]